MACGMWEGKNDGEKKDKEEQKKLKLSLIWKLFFAAVDKCKCQSCAGVLCAHRDAKFFTLLLAACTVCPAAFGLGCTCHFTLRKCQTYRRNATCHKAGGEEASIVCVAQIEVWSFPFPGSRLHTSLLHTGVALCGTPMLHVQINFNELSLVANELQNSKTHRDVFSAQRASCLVRTACGIICIGCED